MKEKVKNALIGIWGLFWYISTCFGAVDILENIIPFKFSIFVGGLFTTGSFLGLFYLLDKENKNNV